MSHGKCPTCNEDGFRREKRPNGHTTCKNGHKHLSKDFDNHEKMLLDKAAPSIIIKK